MIDETAVRQLADEFAAKTSLTSQAEFDTAVNGQLARISGMNLGAKRRNTILQLAEAEINPIISRHDVFSRRDCVSARIFYDTGKDWFHGDAYRQVLENVLALYRRWDAEENIRETMRRQREWKEKAYGIGNDMGSVVETMLKQLLSPMGLDDVIVKEGDKDGETIIQLAPKWAPRDLPGIATAADKMVRLSLDMATDKTAMEIDARTSETTPDEMRQQIMSRLSKTGKSLREQLEKQIAEADTAVADEGEDD